MVNKCFNIDKINSFLILILSFTSSTSTEIVVSQMYISLKSLNFLLSWSCPIISKPNNKTYTNFNDLRPREQILSWQCPFYQRSLSRK